ncbi:MAG: PocR ligand-binding domain-containing protein [Planctomycetes bacterium]|nr:PocR ligand-binding domain-containing protein [Planctomycetota bacterium]
MALLMEYIFQPQVQNILDDLGALFGVRATFLSPAMEELRVGQQRAICPYCRKIQQDLGQLAACVAGDRAHCEQSARRRQVVSYRCHAGLNEAVAPITVDDLLVGFVMIGQFRLAARPPQSVLRSWRKAGRPERQLLRVFSAVPLLEVERMNHVIRIFDLLVQFIVRQHLVGIQGRGIVNSLLLHMTERPEQSLSLDEAAALVHRSPSTVSHQFHRTFGQSFKRTQIELRLRKAEQYLRRNPEMQVAAVAAMVGYSNTHYFSRLFRKHRGMSPTQYRLAAESDVPRRQKNS